MSPSFRDGRKDDTGNHKEKETGQVEVRGISYYLFLYFMSSRSSRPSFWTIFKLTFSNLTG